MRHVSVILLSFLGLSRIASGQVGPLDLGARHAIHATSAAIHVAEKQGNTQPITVGAEPKHVRASLASANFDATWYHLEIAVDFALKRISGTTRVEGRFTTAGSTLELDLLSNMVVSAVRDSTGADLVFAHNNDVLSITLGATIPVDGRVIVEIDYSGQPVDTGFGSFKFDTRDGKPVAWTLSEPYGARSWWPGKDHPSDKPDSARVTVTVPADLVVGSNGTLASRTESGTDATYDWVVHYPIATYLLSLAIGPYELFEQTYERPDSLAESLGSLSLPIEHYKYPTNGSASLPAGWAEVTDALAVFEWWFGAYPFAEEKYGHAEFGWGGGMEHQTLTSMGGFTTSLMTHELAHQWFGDAVTTRTWPHLWLNEGFASYAEILYWETMADRYPNFAAGAILDDQIRAKTATRTLVVADTSSTASLFASNLVYAKGSAVLHMLRSVLGDEAFREMLHQYIADPSLRYGTATTADLQRVAESVSGIDLDDFFRQWVTVDFGYPKYEVLYSASPATAGGYDLSLTINQKQSSEVPFFHMPVTVAVTTTAGEERFVVDNNAREQTFTLHTDAWPLDVQFDPDGVLLTDQTTAVSIESSQDAHGEPVLIWPNPASSTLHAELGLSMADQTRVSVVDLLGRNIRTVWAGIPVTSRVRMDLSVDDLAAGSYLLVVKSPSGVRSRVFQVVR